MKGRAEETGAEREEVVGKEVRETEGHKGDCGSSGTERGEFPASGTKEQS